MFQTHILNNKINKLHEQFFRVSSEDLLKNDRSISAHHNNAHAVKIEINKVINGSFPEIVNKK